MNRKPSSVRRIAIAAVAVAALAASATATLAAPTKTPQSKPTVVLVHGAFADASRIHRIDHVGKRYRVQGPHLSAPSPQRTPVLFQAGSSPAGRRFAARNAEAQFVFSGSPEKTRELIADTERLHQRIARLDDAWRQHFEMASPVRAFQDRLGRELGRLG